MIFSSPLVNALFLGVGEGCTIALVTILATISSRPVIRWIIRKTDEAITPTTGGRHHIVARFDMAAAELHEFVNTPVGEGIPATQMPTNSHSHNLAK